ncbi:ice-binding family protein [Amycolatopsis sp. H20-H5]|uniref:ice-binding family protein n=1 Tax=Amycolatopsis sp. H20-H5 TaxID=3046309 RepID=UPI002DB55C17|nr:ice-binding family protein [Amycolatopsis sp. H20-H5]MEC3982005.1 ice-binding family protein [Amycolatopsis sp. H20-H5]
MRALHRTGSALAAIALAVGVAVVVPAAAQAATSPPFGSASNFAVLGASTVTNTGPTVVTGDLGVSPGTAVVGFPPGSVVGTVHTTDAVAAQAQADVGTAITYAAGEPCDTNLTGQDLGGLTLPPGVYCFNSSAQLTGTLTLDAQGNPNAAWVIQVASSLTTGSNAAVVLTGGATPCNHDNITWQIGASATIGTGTSFVGNILAGTSITVAGNADSTGSLYAHTGAVTMDSNKVSTCAGAGNQAGPTITTTPSGSVPVGGALSDTARLTGGASPTGTVTFTLFGPGDLTCAAPIATRTSALTGRTATSGPVPAGAVGTYNWMATYSGDSANRAVTSLCGSEQVVVTAQVLTGRAYGLSATTVLLGGPLITVLPVPDTGFVSTPLSSTTSTPCVATLSGAISAHALCANVTTQATPAMSTAAASVADATVAVTAIPVTSLRAVQSSSTTNCAGSAGTTTIAFLQVGTTVVIAKPTQIAPNTAVEVGVVSLVLNEQIPFTAPDQGLTVNAVHLRVSALGLSAVNVVVASSESDIRNCPQR